MSFIDRCSAFENGSVGIRFDGVNGGVIKNSESFDVYSLMNEYYSLEKDLIKYPRINLVAQLEEDLLTNTTKTIKKYEELIDNKNAYYTNATALNNLGYKLLNNEKPKASLLVFKLLVSEFPDNFNAYDSLGEAYFKNKEYKNELIQYNKTLDLNPNNQNVKKYIKIINEIVSS